MAEQYWTLRTSELENINTFRHTEWEDGFQRPTSTARAEKIADLMRAGVVFPPMLLIEVTDHDVGGLLVRGRQLVAADGLHRREGALLAGKRLGAMVLTDKTLEEARYNYLLHNQEMQRPRMPDILSASQTSVGRAIKSRMLQFTPSGYDIGRVQALALFRGINNRKVATGLRDPSVMFDEEELYKVGDLLDWLCGHKWWASYDITIRNDVPDAHYRQSVFIGTTFLKALGSVAAKVRHHRVRKLAAALERHPARFNEGGAFGGNTKRLGVMQSNIMTAYLEETEKVRA